MLSFPMPGVTLALDFPNHGERTLRLFERLDAIVREPEDDSTWPRTPGCHATCSWPGIHGYESSCPIGIRASAPPFPAD